MFEERTYKRTFYSAPQSVTSLFAAFLEPTIIVAAYIAISLQFDEPIQRPALTLCLLVFALTFPGRNRFRDNLIAAGVDIVSSWVTLLVILALCGYATFSLKYFEENVLLAWALITPCLQWAAVWVGGKVVRASAARPENRRTAIIVGAGALGVKVAKAIGGGESGIDFAGYFDDRTDGRVDAEAASQRLGGLADVAGYIRAHSIREVFITLPLGSQPRIVELLEQVQGTTASLYFVPDVFGISIIQG
ncbi:MAG: undecaprenyl-phosphate glucose phosphotransferase, partial [Burkholderiales bacterium]